MVLSWPGESPMVVLHLVNHPKVTDRRSGDYGTRDKRTGSYPALARDQLFLLMGTLKVQHEIV